MSGIIREVLEKELLQKNVQYFIGGSSRFGYNTPNSDLDIAILDTSGDILSIVRDLGGEGNWDLKGRRYISNLAEVFLFGGKVHFIIFTKLEGYLSLKKEHEEINSFLKENPVLLNFLKEYKTKVGKTNGTIIYNSIKEIMRNFKKGNHENQEKEVRPSQRFLRIKTEEEVKK